MITIKNESQIAKMRVAGALLYEVEQQLREAVKPGVTTAELDELAERLIRKGNAVPSFLGYEGFPASICASVDEKVVHGIPSKNEVLKEGQLISIDCGLILDGWQADSAFTVGVGKISAEKQKLIDVTEQCFFAAARAAVAGNRLGDVGHACQEIAERNGYGVVRDLTGHGIGREMHEDPAVYNFGLPGHGLRLRKGMCIAVEPMIAMGTWQVDMDRKDGWTVRTRDRKPCAHYEHTLAIGDGLPELLTYPGFTWEEEA